MKAVLRPWISLTLLAIAVEAGPSSTDAPARHVDWVQAYRISPPAVHRQLRQMLLTCEPTDSAVSAIETATGDRSFCELRVMTPPLREALLLREQALELWEDAQPTQAVRLYLDAAQLLEAAGLPGEASLSLYLAAEVLAEEQLFHDCLPLLDRADRLAAGLKLQYFEALLAESRGYASWYLDRLPDAIQAFALASQRWNQVGYRDGRIAAWNNLATLYEHLGMPEEAEGGYRNALDLMTEETDRTIQVSLLCNLAGLLHDSGRNHEARVLLRQARELAGESSEELLLMEARVLGHLAWPKGMPRTPSGEILARLNYLSSAPAGWKRSETLLRDALDLSRRHVLPIYEREIVLRLGEVLEDRGGFEEAARLYLGLIQRQVIPAFDWVFPFQQALQSQVAGLVRSLVRVGRPWEALALLRQLWSVRLRQTALRPPPRVVETLPVNPLEAHLRLSQSDPPAAEALLRKPLVHEPVLLPPETTLYEAWVDSGDRTLFAWIESEDGRVFREIPISSSWHDELKRVESALRYDGSLLPPIPDSASIERLSRAFLQPVEDLLVGNRLLLVPHGRLAEIPFELLRTSNGSIAAQSWSISYLPSPMPSFLVGERVSGSGLALLPVALQERSNHVERTSLKSLDPDLAIYERLDQLPARLEAPWIHVAVHLHGHPRHWFLGELDDELERISILDLAGRRFRCELLSLASCQTADPGPSGPHHWLGLTSLLLSRGCQAVIASRWNLDERSVPIYTAALQYAAGGMSLDRALAKARLDYLEENHERWTGHPFFWAGIVYVGRPGKHLSHRPASPPSQDSGPDWIVPVITAVLLAGYRAARACGRDPSLLKK